nr:TlpA disulfide reductase family protein [Algoriphagus pacificus]
MYVYVDLWAAWCIPCIRSFPESRSLQDEYHNKGLEVVYLSVDKNHKFWEEVIQKYDIAFPDRSYIVMNIDESAYLKEINVELIPRYILFDPQGNLIHPNAPRPESKEIRVLLDSLTSD